MDTIDLYAAIEEMKRISDTGGTFSMKFRKYNRHTSAGGDMVTVKAARLRSKTSDEKIENSSYKLFYQVAVEEGATLVRVGTGIFGERNYEVI